MELLLLSIGLLLGAPLVYGLFAKRRGVRKWVERIVGIAMVAILGVHVIPEAIHAAGPGVLIATGVGFTFIILAEKLPSLSRFGARHFALMLAFAGLALHTTIDGLALFMPELHSHAGHGHGHVEATTGAALAWAVILHRLPVGLFTWGYLRGKFSATIAYAVLVGMSLATLGGFLAGDHLHAIGEMEGNLAWIQAFVAGSLLHIVLDPWLHKHDCQDDETALEVTPGHQVRSPL